MRILKTIIALAVVAAMVGGLIAAAVYYVPRTDRVTMTQYVVNQQNLEAIQERCPLSETTILEMGVLAPYCGLHGTVVYRDWVDYPEQALRIWTLLGETEEFPRLRKEYGKGVLLLAYSYLTGDSTRAEVLNNVGDVLKDVTSVAGSIWKGLMEGDSLKSLLDQDWKSIVEAPAELTPLQDLAFIIFAMDEAENAHSILNRYQFHADGTVTYRSIAGNFQAAFDLGISHILAAETKVINGETLTPTDIGWAAFEAVAIMTGLKVFKAKGAVAKGAAAAQASFAGKVFISGKWLAATGVKTTALVSFGYVGYRIYDDPTVVVTALPNATALTFEAWGLPEWLGAAVGWLLVLMATLGILALLSWIFGWVKFFTWPFRKVFGPLFRWAWSGPGQRPQTT